MSATLSYVMEFVADMDHAVRFYRDTVGLTLKFQSPQWSEFSTGDTTFALHPASQKNPPGKIELGFGVDDLNAFYDALTAKGVRFPVAPKTQDYGGMLAQFEDVDGAWVSVSGR
jgi:predicted enzyme related to lactoylglutathione lyase